MLQKKVRGLFYGWLQERKVRGRWGRLSCFCCSLKGHHVMLYGRMSWTLSLSSR
jgi:hypothetical protein